MKRPSGFTLLEMIISIVILGILAGMVAVFIAKPVQGYIDSTRRAQLTDMADLALKRMALELRTALPNSVKPIAATASSYIEFIPSIGSGRYCTDTESCTNKFTNFGTGATDTGTFDVLGPLPSGITANSDRMIIFNTGQTGLDAYSNSNCAKLTNTTSPLTYSGASPFPYASPSSRFFVAPSSGSVKFNCTTTAVQRISGASNFCGITPPPSLTTATLVSADEVICAFSYTSVSASNGLLTLRLTLTSSGESVTLANQIHVDNLP
jgi:MSHA biogenesis protein MshO